MNPISSCGNLGNFLLKGELVSPGSKKEKEEVECVENLLQLVKQLRTSIKNHREQNNISDAREKFAEMSNALRSKKGVPIYHGALAEIFEGDLAADKAKRKSLGERIEKNSKYARLGLFVTNCSRRLMRSFDEEQKQEEVRSGSEQLWDERRRSLDESFDQASFLET